MDQTTCKDYLEHCIKSGIIPQLPSNEYACMSRIKPGPYAQIMVDDPKFVLYRSYSSLLGLVKHPLLVRNHTYSIYVRKPEEQLDRDYAIRFTDPFAWNWVKEKPV